MKIGIDVSLAAGKKAGGGYYVENLVHALSQVDSENRYILYPYFGQNFRPLLKRLNYPSAKNFSVYHRNYPLFLETLWRKKRGLDHEAYYQNIDILHCTSFFISSHFHGKLIATIYDISFLIFPECHTEANRLYCLQGTLDAVFRCEKLIAISENTKSDLINYFNVEPERITVTHLAPGNIFKPNNNQSEKKLVLEKYGIERPYIFSLGSIEPRKNLIRLIQAYAGLEASVKKEVDLVIGGASGWLDSDVSTEVKVQKLEDKVRFLGYIEGKDLPVLYSAANMFVYPSLYEGFGLPVIEAMACGTPVITSNNSSLKEIAEGAAVLVDPLDVSDISSAIQTVLSDSNFSSKLSADGVARASKFSWLKTAEKTLEVYKALINQQ